MNVDSVRELIYSRCKAYRKEKDNPFELRTDERSAWEIERIMMRYRIENLKHYTKEYESLSDSEIADMAMDHILKRYFSPYPEARKRYEQLKQLPFPAQ